MYKMRFVSIIILNIIILFVINNSILAITYNVSSATEIERVLKRVQAGDSLVMQNGTWKDQKIIFECNGKVGKPITLCAEIPGKVILSGKSQLRISGTYLKVDGLFFKDGYSPCGDVIEFRDDSDEVSDYCRLTNCVILSYNPSNKDTEYKWVSIYGTHNRVDHCYFKGKENIGTMLVVWVADKPNFNLIDHNYFGHRSYLQGKNNGETIRIGSSENSYNRSKTIVEFNLFEECNGEIEIISNKSCENIFRHNTFNKCKGSLTLRHGNRCVVKSNYFFGHLIQNTRGVRVIGEDHKIINNYFCELRGSKRWAALSLLNGIPDSPPDGFFQVKHAIIAFNTFVNNRHTLNIGAGANDERTLPPLDCTFANNIIVSDHDPLIRLDAVPQNMKWLGNIVFGASLGFKQIEGISIVDPKLHLYRDRNGLWRPDKSSPVTKAAKGDFSFIKEDIEGQTRQKGKKDVGCDQISNAPVLYRPLNIKDVAPNWILELDE